MTRSKVTRRVGAIWLIFLATGLAGKAFGQSIAFQSFPNNATHSAAAVAEAIANVPADAGLVYDADGQTDDIQIWNYGVNVYNGMVDVTSTLDRIRDGDWFPTETDDGGFFNLDDDELPNIPPMGNDYYMEFVVWPYMDLTAGTYDPTQLAYGEMAFPGAMRLLIGLGGQVYFTGDHYGESGPQQDAYYVTPIPEPSTIGLFVLVPAALVRWRKRANHAGMSSIFRER